MVSRWPSKLGELLESVSDASAALESQGKLSEAKMRAAFNIIHALTGAVQQLNDEKTQLENRIVQLERRSGIPKFSRN